MSLFLPVNCQPWWRGYPKLGSKAPAPPDPYAQADAQTQSNQETATYNNAIGHGNTYTPVGNSTYTGRVDPVTGATVYDQTVSLDPAQQQLLDTQNQQDLALGQTGNKMLGQIDAAVGKPIDTSGLPALSGVVTPNGPGIQGQIDTNGLPQLYGADDLLGARQQVADALYKQQSSYLDPQYANREQALRTELANKGVAEGSEAWNNLRDQFDRGRTFDYARARDSAITGSGSEMQRLSDIALANRGEQFGERATTGGFQNDAQRQALAQALTQAQFGNQTRAQGMDELYAQRAQPLNEFSALRSASQVNVPQFAAAQNSTTNPADIGGYIGQNYQDKLAAWQQQQSGIGGVLGGLFGLGSAAIAKSDRRLKSDIEHVGYLPNGLKTYRYRYNGEDQIRMGVMADEVAVCFPKAVHRFWDGYDRVDYAVIGALHLLRDAQ